MNASGEADKTGGPRYRVRAVDRAIDILDLLGRDTGGAGLSVTEVAARTSLSKSAAFATLFTLTSSGLVATTGEAATRRYRLGPALIRLGALARAQISLSDLARPYLLELARESRATARLAVLESDEVVVIDQVSPPIAMRRDLRMGSRELLHSTGLGKAILAALPESRARSMVAKAGMPARTARTYTDPDRLFAHLATVEKQGYVLDDEEDAEGVFCVGSPIRDHTGECVGAISITGAKVHQPAAFYQGVGQRVRAEAQAISTALGYAEPPAG